MQANSRCQLTREFEVIRSSGDHIHQIFAYKPYKLAEICPSIIQGCNAEGELGKNGFIIIWNYAIDGKTYVAKEMIENLDVEKKTITLRVIQGDLLNHYKTFLAHLHVIPKDGNMSVVKWTFEYEKLHEDVPDPTSHADLLGPICKQLADRTKA